MLSTPLNTKAKILSRLSELQKNSAKIIQEAKSIASTSMEPVWPIIRERAMELSIVRKTADFFKAPPTEAELQQLEEEIEYKKYDAMERGM